MGWLGWNWDRVKNEDVNVLQMAMDGRSELLLAIFGDGSSKRPVKGRGVSAERFRAFARRHNAAYAAGRRKRGAAGGD